MARSRGRPPHPDVLTPAEWDVLHALRHGMSNRAIARRRGTSVDAVKYHVANIAGKLDARGRPDLRQFRGAPAGSPIHAQGVTAVTTNFSLGPIGQVALTVSDLAAAEPFYRDTLGLKHLFTFGNLAFFDCGGVRLFITAATDAEHSRNHSVVYFWVPDIHSAHETLSGRGVPFEGAPHMIHRHEDGTEEWMAFFRDPDANILAIMSHARP
jgi:DNA-binding CsgD family transcriptional regulator/catechol 2,3-dioxygenase-like lactoylglutathione lyase family enzyme